MSQKLYKKCDNTAWVDKLYEEKRKIAQLECISFMYDLGLYVRMHDFIYNISLSRKLTSSLAYWDIKAITGMKRLDMASRLLKEELAAMIQKM